MTELERELLFNIAKICAEGRGQDGELIYKMIRGIEEDLYIKSLFGARADDTDE